ncbi:MAG: hypothetical protein ACFBWO_17410 [Paracoccaceae bacterium]
MDREMIDDLTLIARASALARHAAAASRVAAENVANADVPGYRARGVADFAATLDRLDTGFRPRVTRAGHFAGPAPEGPRVRVAEGPAAPNGNSVSIEGERMAAAEAASRHRLALAIRAEVVDLVRLGLGRGR